MKFWEFYRIISRRRWMVLALVGVTSASIYLSTLNEKPYYSAAVQIMPSDTALYRPILPSPGASIAGALGERQTDSQLPNLLSLIKSRRVAERTIQVANLNEDPDSLLGRVEVGTAPNPGARSRQEMGTDIIEIKVSDTHPKEAVRTVNALAHVFANFYQEISHQEASDNRRFLESELARAGSEVDRTSEKLKGFKRDNRITSIADATSAASADMRQAVAQRDSARAALANAQAKLNEVNRQLLLVGPTRTVYEGTSNTPMVTELETQLAQLTRQLNEARSKYEEVHPQVVAMKDSLEEVRRKLNGERGKLKTTTQVVRNPVYESLLQQRSTLAADRDGLAAQLGQLEASAARASGALKPGMDVNLARLEGEFLAAQATYQTIQSQLNQARLNEKETTATGAIRVIDEAVEAVGPLGVNRWAYMFLGAVLSLIVAAGLAITLDSLDNRIRTNLDVERLLGLPVTALIPKSLDSTDTGLARAVYTQPLSPISEAYRFLRTDLLLSSEAIGAKSIMVATAKPGQGGTCTVANLGISLAQDGKRVVLVDGDMRRPSLHRIFKVQNERGLSNILANEKDLEDVILSTEVENLLVIPAGPTPSNPSELLGSQRMKALLQKLTENADYVLLDTPSAVAFTDAVVLSRIVDGVLLVVRAQQVPRGAELQVRDLLNKANATILGVVLNDVQPEMVDSYYYHSHYYPDMGKKIALVGVRGGSARSLPPKGQPE
ncbi:MAG TPA: polysaccharide biosynthesis tyrosine autokinase [Armatimonadota bacterium]|nr:polysaccharide biosynthesis tyrosine autokinase [Armatimonadota bacterium]